MVWLLEFLSEWGRELESCVPHLILPLPPPIPGIWGGVTCDPDADRRAFLTSMARVGGHAAVNALILMLYLRQEQHRAEGKGQGCALVGKRGRRLLDTLPTHPGLHLHSLTFCLPAHWAQNTCPALAPCLSLPTLRPSEALTSFIQWI